MSTNKRQKSPDEAAEDNSEPHSALPRKKPRVSSIEELIQDGRSFRPGATHDDDNKLPSAPKPPFGRRARLTSILERARSANRNERPHTGHRRPGTMSSPFSPNSYPYSGPPEFFDVAPGLPDAIPPLNGEMPFWKAEHAAFINSDSGLNGGNWIGRRPLGAGSFGTAGLWERRDENNVLEEVLLHLRFVVRKGLLVSKEIVIKESKTMPIDRWNGQVPEEVKMMRRMNNTDCQSVPDLITYKRYMHVRKHRIYMEYCPYSDLERLNLNYKRFRTYLPESFLWHTFKNLVQVAAAMQHGPEGNRWGYQIVHRDLKPTNIFLGLEDHERGFSSYPVAKTGDWGLATKIVPGDHRNPIELRGAGTEAYHAPEQRIHLKGDDYWAEIKRHQDGTSPLPKLSAHTNVWGIGAIMFELLTHEAVAYYLGDEKWTVDEVFMDIPNVRSPKYSGALTELIRLCLMPDPWDRPSIEELELKIGAKCQRIIDEYAANPGLEQKDRLYYRGSEINSMPPGNWHYWNPVMGDVPKPSEPPDSQEPRNPFTADIIYPWFPTFDSDSFDDGGEAQNGIGDNHDDGDDKRPKGPRSGGIAKPIVIPDKSSSNTRGDNIRNPVIILDSGEKDGKDERSEKSRTHQADEVYDGEESSQAYGNDGSNGSSGSTGSGKGSDDSDNSDVRRRMAVKKLPGT